MEVVKVTVMGSLATATYFKDKEGVTYRVEVRLESLITSSNQVTAFIAYFFKKGFKCRNYEYLGKSTDVFKMGDTFNWKSILTDQDLYIAYHNHWDNLNPIKVFCTHHLNNQHKEFSVTPIEPAKADNIFCKKADSYNRK